MSGEKEKFKLLEIMSRYGVNIYDREYYCLNDLVKKFIPYADHKQFVNQFPNRITLDNKIYISAHGCLRFLRKNNTKLCKEVVSLIDELPIGVSNDETSDLSDEEEDDETNEEEDDESDQESDYNPVANFCDKSSNNKQNVSKYGSSNRIKEKEIEFKLNKLNYLFKKRKLNNLLCLINF